MLDTDGYAILASYAYGYTYPQSKLDHHLFCALRGNTTNGSVDDKTMNWNPVLYKNKQECTSSSSSKNYTKTRQKRTKISHQHLVGNQFFSTNINAPTMASLQQDICHFQPKLNLQEGITVQAATINI